MLLIGPLPPGVGGMRTYFRGLRTSELSNMFDLVVVRSDFVGKVFHRGLRRHVLNVANAVLLGAAVLYTIATRRPRLLHVQTNSGFGFYEKSFLSLLGRLFLIKTIVHVHGGGFRSFYDHQGRFVRWATRLCIRLNERIIVATPQMRETFEAIGFGSRVRLVRNAVNTPSRSIWDQRAPRVSADEVTVLFLNRIAKAKGVLEFVDAAAAVAAEFTNARFRIVGAGTQFRDEVKKRIASLDASSRIQFIGEVSEEVKEREFRSSDLYVLPSHVEDLPLGLLEAMALGIPCIATAVGGIPSLIEHNTSGLLVEPHDVEALGQALRRLIGDPALRREVGTRARLRIESEFSWSRRAAQVAGVYEELLSC